MGLLDGRSREVINKELDETRGKRWLYRRHHQLLRELTESGEQPMQTTENRGKRCVTRNDDEFHYRRQKVDKDDADKDDVDMDDADKDDADKDDEIPDNLRAATFDTNGEDFCKSCDVPMRLVPHRALMVCTRCGCFSSYIDSTTSSMAYGDGIEINSMYCYKRLNHFRLQLAQLQATESFEVPQDIIDRVLFELLGMGIVNPGDVTLRTLREILKKMRLRKQYDHIAQIHSRVTGIPPIRLPPEIEERLRLMFISIQSPFNKACPAERTNFLSYKYILYKFCQLLGLDQILPLLSLLKGKDKLLRQDKIYREICKELGWVFIPSI